MSAATGLITDVAVQIGETALTEPFTTSRGSVTTLSVVQVVVSSDDGYRGSGVVAPATRLTGETAASIAAAVRLCGPVVIGRPYLPLAGRMRDIENFLPGNAVAKCGVDLALHALVANSARLPFPRMLGAPDAPRVATDVTITLDDVDSMVAAAEARIGDGFTTLKLKVGTEPAADLARVVAVAGASEGRATLRLDANQGWSARDAVAVLSRLHELDVSVEFVEQPVKADDLSGLRWVRQRTPFPVMADESVRTPADVLRIAETEAADLINIKLAKHGGVLGARAVVAVAATVGLDCMVGSMMEAVDGVAASMALASTMPWPGAHDLDAARWLAPGPGRPGEPAVSYEPPWVHARWSSVLPG